ncbi:MAG TPA: AraC family transcriptional regulator [Gammaproteobacteria bacterium]|nr:AraC family transcriptional regulator [Gammaproteobacteria bacterium]
MSQDTLSDVLRSVRLRSAVFYFVSCEGEWVAVAPASRDIAAAVMPDAERVIEYHVVTAGECWIAIAGEPPLKLKRGDVIMLPQGDAHVVSSTPGMSAAADVDSFFEMQRSHRPFRLHYPGGSEPQLATDGRDERAATKIVCGFIGCDVRPFNPLLATLPRLLHLPAVGSGRSEQFAELAAEESARKRPGADALLERLSEMMFVDAIRRHVDRLPDESTGWLAGLRDRFVGRALALLHERPAADWTVEELSRQVGLSRSALHERFVALIGQPPMQYLTQWRMQAASRLLRDTRASVASIALDVGYDSEAAFARAFKRAVGLPPAAWRRQAHASGAAQQLAPTAEQPPTELAR